MTGLPWFKFFPRDWISGTRGLSDRARGAYIDLLARMYDLGRPLDHDERDLCRYLGYRDGRQFRPVLAELIDAGKITIADGKITNGRAMTELAKSDHHRQAGKKGGRPKKGSRTASGGDLEASRYQVKEASFEEKQSTNENPPEARSQISESKKRRYAFEGQVVRLTEPDFQRWESAFKNVNLRALLESRDAWLSSQPDAMKKTWFQSTAAWLANRDAEATKTQPADGSDIDPNWRDRMERAKATLRERDGKVVPGPGRREPGAAA